MIQIGEIINDNWKVLEQVDDYIANPPSRNGKTIHYSRFKIVCIFCGYTRIIRSHHLMYGQKCQQCKVIKGIPAKHPIRNTYTNIVRRTTDPKYPEYARYGGSGIGIYQPWLETPSEFLK